jgi:DNA adenine methylase
VRLLIACLLAKLDRPAVDVRKPYTEIGGSDTFSGRGYDEGCVARLLHNYSLPINPTTAFLTPALRNHNQPLTLDQVPVGRPKQVYVATLELLDAVQRDQVSAEDLLIEVIRDLVILRGEQKQSLAQRLALLNSHTTDLFLSVEGIVKLIGEHLEFKNSARLPVLVVAAAYMAAAPKLGEQIRSLLSHNAADRQTGALGDVEVELTHDGKLVTAYEMKQRRVGTEDINLALDKIERSSQRIDNYIFITTEIIDDEARIYARNLYEQTGGIEIAILNCQDFLRHFLHLFHRDRITFVDIYQELLLNEPTSAVSSSLKEAFLVLRHTAEELLALKQTTNNE